MSYFTRQFLDVAQANEWNQAATLLHLRESLKGNAQDCGNAETADGVLQALQARFGLSVREARCQITALRKNPKTTLQEHAAEVSRLANIAYADLPRDNKQRRILDLFQSTLGNAYLQRHLLAVNTPTIEEAVRAGNEFLQIKPMSMPNSNICTIEDDEEDRMGVQEVRTTPIEEMIKTVKKLTEEIEELKNNQKIQISRQMNEQRRDNFRPNMRDITNAKATLCWGCGQPGHNRKQCKVNPWNRFQQQTTGNGLGPQQ